MGIDFKNADIQNGEWIEIEDRNRRKKRKRQANEIDLKAKTMIQKPKKVSQDIKRNINEKRKILKKGKKNTKRKNNIGRGDVNVKIGSHVSMSGKKMLLAASEEAVSYGANTFMIYTGAPQNTRRKKIEDLNIETGRTTYEGKWD